MTTQSGVKRNKHPRLGIHHTLACGHHKFISRGSQVYKGRTNCPQGCGKVRVSKSYGGGEHPMSNPTNCTGCGKAISGAYEAGSYSCSDCGAGVEINPAKKSRKPKAPKPAVEGLAPEQVDKIDDILSFTSTVGELDIALSIGRTVDERFKTDITAYKVVLDGRVNMPIGLFEVPTDAPADTHSDAQMAGRVVHEAIQKYLAQK